MRQLAALGLAVLVLVALPGSARSDTAKTIVEGTAGALLVGILCSSVVLVADDEIDEDDFARRGWLAGLGGSYAHETFEDDAEKDFQRVLGPDVSLAADNSFGANIQAGYRCHRHFSAEFEAEWLDGFKADLTEPGFDQLADVEYETIVATANLKGYFLTGRNQPYLLLGFGGMMADRTLRDPAGLFGVPINLTESRNSFAMRFGGGVDVYATKNVVLNLGVDYVLPFGNLDALDYVTINWGVQYRF